MMDKRFEFRVDHDPVEYFTRTWHTTQDVSDRILEEDLKRSAIIMASFAYNSAMTDAKLPRREMAATAVSPILRGFNFRTEMDEITFRNSGLNHSISVHDIRHEEIPVGFPGILTVGTNNFASGD
jgi:hypothetical protein